MPLHLGRWSPEFGTSGKKLGRIIGLLERANEELRSNLDAHKRDMLGQEAYDRMNDML